MGANADICAAVQWGNTVGHGEREEELFMRN